MIFLGAVSVELREIMTLLTVKLSQTCIMTRQCALLLVLTYAGAPASCVPGSYWVAWVLLGCLGLVGCLCLTGLPGSPWAAWVLLGRLGTWVVQCVIVQVCICSVTSSRISFAQSLHAVPVPNLIMQALSCAPFYSVKPDGLGMLCLTGSDLLGETVAALAAIAIVFQSIDATYANSLEAHARDLYV